MKLSRLQQPLLAKLLDWDSRADRFAQQAEEAERELERYREVLSGRRQDGDLPDRKARRDFDAIYAHAQRTRQRANDEQRALSTTKLWLERLPDDARLEEVKPELDGHDLVSLRQTLQTARSEIAKLKAVPL